MSKQHWIHDTVLYQIYPRSFYDSDDNGVGDLNGIAAKLDYLVELGIGPILISPCYPSPMADFGYDVSNYQDVDPVFGTLDDFRALKDQAHSRGIKVIVDFVPNHTSDEHPWFIESRASRDSPKRDWYTWHEPQPDGTPPNNWQSLFGGSAWQLDKGTNQYYLHSFLAKQPDLNWDNPEVRSAMADNVRFWLEMGVDGIRVDAVNWLSKDEQLRDNPPNPDYEPAEGVDPYNAQIHTYSAMGSHIFDYLNVLQDVVKSYDDRFMIIESYPDHPGDHSHYLSFYRNLDQTVTAPFNFDAIGLPWSAQAFRSSIGSYMEKLRPGDTAIYSMGNHDQHRLATRFGQESCRTAAMMLLTLPGTPIIYYGDEIGMHDTHIPPEFVQDPFEKNNPGHNLGRDPERTPMQWSDAPHAGFTTAEPWLPISGDYTTNNVVRDLQNPRSLLTLYRELLQFRSTSDVLRYGNFELLDHHEDVFAYKRMYKEKILTILLNFSGNDVDVDISAQNLVFSTLETTEFGGSLKPHEAVILTSDN